VMLPATNIKQKSSHVWLHVAQSIAVAAAWMLPTPSVSVSWC
jgi:hypothetical protein